MDCGTLYLIVNEQKTDVTTIQKAIAARSRHWRIRVKEVYDGFIPAVNMIGNK
jgi:hypothetical protein